MTIDLHQRGVELAEEGMYDEALSHIREHLLGAPRDGCALNDAGAILFALGYYDQAAAHLQSATEVLGNDPSQALWNLCETHLARGAPEEAMALFDQMEQAELLRPDVVNRTAASLIDAGDLAGAVEALVRSLGICQDQDVLIPILELIRSKRAKIAFFCGNCADRRDDEMSALSDIFAHTVARFETQLIYDSSARQTAKVLRWCDIAWFDACAELIPPTPELPDPCRIIVRLPAGVELAWAADRTWWQNIDAAVIAGAGPLGQPGSKVDLGANIIHLPDWPQMGKPALRQVNELFCELERQRGCQVS